MAKVQIIRDEPFQVWFHCPGCKCMHVLDIRWTFNNDVDSPTFSPSYLTWYPKDGVEQRCHSYITDGKIQFLDDSTHELKGQTVELPDVNKY